MAEQRDLRFTRTACMGRFKHTNLGILVGAFLLSGCIAPIPIYDDPPFAEPRKSIEIGQTTRRDVLDLLGAPAVERRSGQLHAYTEFQDSIGLLIIGVGDAGIIRFGEQNLLAITFDQAGIVENVELVTESARKTANGGLTRTTHCISSGECFVSKRYEVTVFANAAEDSLAKSFRADPEECTLYIYGYDESEFWVKLDEGFRRRTIAGGYFRWNLSPGSHNFVASAQSVINDATLKIACGAGEIVYVQYIDPGAFKNMELVLMSATEGQAGVQTRKLVLED